MKTQILVIVFVLGISVDQCVAIQNTHIIDQKQVAAWAHRIGMELWGFATHVTKLDKIKENFTEARVEHVDPEALLSKISKSIEDMMFNKISALKRIADTAERVAFSIDEEENVSEFSYWNTNNNITEIESNYNSNFYGLRVNTAMSAIHVPTNVYDGSEEVLRVAKWSQALNDIFVNNYQEDPSLSWQFFGSTTGALRVFPAYQWDHFLNQFAPPGRDEPMVDLYDSRVREWYINAAASPKDMLILLDNSGSMMGQRREIARHVINNLLDTLGNNDYVNVLQFNQSCQEVVSCFKDILVQANLANVRELKMGVENITEANNIANFTVALTKAFEMLESFRKDRAGADCNQAIMVVTDGASENYMEVFEEYNWRGQNDSSKWPVRVFSYLVGKEVADYQDVKWMACANKGYYVHLSTLAEVREKILTYVPVMARPLVLQGKEHPIVWTPIYSDVTDPKLSDWLWELKECDEQKIRSINHRNEPWNFTKPEAEMKRAERIKRRSYDQNSMDVSPYRLLTTVSMPAFDKRERIVPCYRVCAKHESFLPFKEPNVRKAFSAPLVEKKVRVANLLGVAGIDVPDTEFKRALLPHELGVNAYGFIVTNNGFILVHPDLRSMFQGILKPSYNSVDLTDIEQVDEDQGPRTYNEKLLAMRQQIIHQQKNSMELPIKYQLDDMRRVSRGIKTYYYKGLKTENVPSPFSLVLAIPQPLGRARVVQQEEIALFRKKVSFQDLLHINWKVHPDWFYCKYNFDPGHYKFTKAEQEVIHFVEKAFTSNWKWPPKTNIPPEKRSNNNQQSLSSTATKFEKYDTKSYYCDRDLFLSLIYDAKQTMSFSKITDYSTSIKSNDPRDNKEFVARFGLTIVFVATRSGLLRWKDNDALKTNESLHFAETNNRAIDEVWYKRAVEQHYVDENSFVFSVPFEAYGSDIDDTFSLDKKPKVTATHAIFVGNAEKKAPVAVVGLQMLHSALQNIFANITSTSIYNKSKIETCKSDNLDCFVLDNNGYVIAADEGLKSTTGLFFGTVNPDVMRAMIRANIYKKITYYDHQSVCFKVETIPNEMNSGRRLLTPLHHISWVFKWSAINMFWYLVQFNANWFGALAFSFQDPDDEGDNIDDDEDLLVEDDLEDEDYVSIKSEAYEDIMADQPMTSSEASVTASSTPNKEPTPSKMTREIIKINRTRPTPCDRKVDLYVLEPKNLVLKDTQRSAIVASMNCSRPYLLELIPNTNLVLVVINTHCYPLKDRSPTFDTTPEEFIYPDDSTMLCYKEKSTVRLVRRKPDHCLKSHSKETNITQLCGRAESATLPNILLVFSLVLFSLLPRMLCS